MIEACWRRGINVLAITDHNVFDGALEMESIAPFTIIPSEEIKTAEGEIIAYFVRRHIPRGLSAEETARLVREQGGVINIPHPFDSLRGSRLRTDALEQLVSEGLVDMIEGLNARTTRPEDNAAAYEFAEKHGLPVAAGSDAHTYGEIGAAYMEIRPFDGPRDFVQAVRAGAVRGGLSPWPVHFASTWAKVVRMAATR